MLLLLLACAPKVPVPEVPDEVPASVTLVPGPWEGARGITVATTGPRDVAGRWSGPAIVIAAWVQPGGQLELSTSFDGGHGWSQPEVLAQGVQVEGATRPRIALARGGAALGVVVDGAPQLVRRGEAGWALEPLDEGAQGSLLEIGSVGGEPVAAWIDTRAEAPVLYGSVMGVAEPIWEGGLCACCRPAVGEVDDLPAVAFRDLDEQGVMETHLLVRTLFEWEDRGRVTHAGWAPEQCPGDGPAFDGEVLLSSLVRGEGDRIVWRDDRPLRSTSGWDAWQPAQVEGVFVRVESTPERNRLVADGLPIIGSEQEIWLGDVAAMPSERLLTWDQGERGYVAAFAPASID
ncbi:MAG: hypothetical protein H6740_23395 [Alphaproteobacteria bacterium]|nr:hypothetical protein [Alphaproteobacteria bacterium]